MSEHEKEMDELRAAMAGVNKVVSADADMINGLEETAKENLGDPAYNAVQARNSRDLSHGEFESDLAETVNRLVPPEDDRAGGE